MSVTLTSEQVLEAISKGAVLEHKVQTLEHQLNSAMSKHEEREKELEEQIKLMNQKLLEYDVSIRVFRWVGSAVVFVLGWIVATFNIDIRGKV